MCKFFEDPNLVVSDAQCTVSLLVQTMPNNIKEKSLTQVYIEMFYSSLSEMWCEKDHIENTIHKERT